MMESSYKQIKFTDADILNPDDFIPAAGEDGRAHNLYNVRLWLMHDHGHCVCAVFTSNLQDALDEAVNCNKLDAYMIHMDDADQRMDYMVKDKVVPMSNPDYMKENPPEYTDSNGGKWWWKDGMEPTYLGNAGEPFDIDTLECTAIPNPKFSFCAMFNAMQTAKEVV